MQKLLMAAVMALSLGACVPASENASGAPTTATATASSANVSAQIGDMVNQQRRASGLNTIRVNSRLNAVAQAHAEEMAARGQMTHAGANGSSPKQRVDASGYRSCTAAENIAFGQASAAEVMNGWMNSPTHRTNILRSNVTEMGVGFAANGRYWVQVFARPC